MSVTVVYPLGDIAVEGDEDRNWFPSQFPYMDTFANLQASTNNVECAGEASLVSSPSTSDLYLGPHPADYYVAIKRYIVVFDTTHSSQTNLQSVTFSLFGAAKSNAFGDTTLETVAATPADPTSLVVSDYANLGSLSKASIPYASFNASGYTDIPLSSGDINWGGLTVLGVRIGFDIGSGSPVWTDDGSGDYIRSGFQFSRNTGSLASPDPKLSFTYPDGPAAPTLAFPVNGATLVPVGYGLNLKWTGGTAPFTLQVSTHSDMSSPVVNITTSAHNYLLSANPLITYYWRVSSDAGAFSSTNSFGTGVRAPGGAMSRGWTYGKVEDLVRIRLSAIKEG